MRRWQIVMVVLAGLVMVGLWVGGMYVYIHAHDDNFRQATGIGMQEGQPFIVHALCGAQEPIGYVEIRASGTGQNHPSDADAVVFAARSTTGPSPSVPIAEHVDGYDVTVSEPLSPDSRYYISALRNVHGVNDLASAPEFKLTELANGGTLTLDGGHNLSDEGTITPNAQWVNATTSC